MMEVVDFGDRSDEEAIYGRRVGLISIPAGLAPSGPALSEEEADLFVATLDELLMLDEEGEGTIEPATSSLD